MATLQISPSVSGVFVSLPLSLTTAVVVTLEPKTSRGGREAHSGINYGGRGEGACGEQAEAVGGGSHCRWQILCRSHRCCSRLDSMSANPLTPPPPPPPPIDGPHVNVKTNTRHTHKRYAHRPSPRKLGGGERTRQTQPNEPLKRSKPVTQRSRTLRRRYVCKYFLL